MKVVYKIINSIAVLAMIPILLFLPMFKFIMTVGIKSDNQILSLLGGMLDVNNIIKMATGIDLENLPETYTIKKVYDMFLSPDAAFKDAKLNVSGLPEDVTKFFTAAAVLFAIALVCALAVLILGIVTNKKRITALVGAGGFAFLFAANKCFTHIASQFVSGKVSMISVLENIEALENSSSYLNYLNINIRIFELSSAYSMLLLVFGVIILLNIGFYLAESTMSN